MIPELKNNIQTAGNLSRELVNFLDKLGMASSAEREIILDIINSLKERIKLINDSVPGMINEITVGRNFRNIKLPEIKTLPYEESSPIAIRKTDLEKYMNELNISRDLVKRLKNKTEKEQRKKTKRKERFYSKLANKFFLEMSQKSIEKGEFKKLRIDLKKSNMDVLSSSYISMMYFSTFISIFLGFFLTLLLIFVDFSFAPPFISLYSGSWLLRIIKVSWVFPAVPAFTFLMFYLYPGIERKSVGKKIDQELPFMVIQMGSISGSGIEPVEIFKIIGLSGDYEHAGREIVKLLNQINIYGYDLVTALSNVSASTPSKRLSELLTGMATTINSGGDLDTFFEKRADSLLVEYALEREKFTKIAETFMDIYISVVIATPMILLLLLVLISISGIGFGLGIGEMSLLIILLVAVINVLFLAFLHMKQPKY